MNRVATCPRCKTVYELDEDDIGHLLECECGAALFACHTRSLDVFEIWCKACGNHHEVRGADVGRKIEVDCGQAVYVPSVMLRLPIGDRKLAARAKAEWQQQREVDVGPEAYASQPTRHPPPKTSMVVGRNGAKNVEGDNVLGIDDIGPDSPVANAGGPDGISLPSESMAQSVSDTTAKHEMVRGAATGVGGEAKKTPLSKRHLGSTLGGGAVAALFVAAVVMFLLRVPPSQKRAKRSKDVGQRITADGTQSIINRDLQPGMGIAGDGVDLLPGNLGVSGLPETEVASVAPVNGVGTDDNGGKYRLPPPTIYALPAQKQPRDRISVQRATSVFRSLQGAMDAAFEEYGTVQKLKEIADASDLQADVDAYRQAIGRTMGVIERVHQLAVAMKAKKETATTRYLLAFLYLKAGMLPEAAVMGEAVVQWGDLTDPSTKEAGMIALAATQELSDLHWGDAEDLGE